MRNRKNYYKKYYLKYRNEKLAYQKQWNETHRNEISSYRKKYWKEHRNERLASMRQYYKEHRNEISVYQKQWCEAHRDELSAYGKQWYEQNKDKKKQQAKAWIKNHKKQWREIERRHGFKRRNLGFVYLNKPFEVSEAHHICATFVIYIPKELHRGVKHSVLRWENMDKINALAFDYLLGVLRP